MTITLTAAPSSVLGAAALTITTDNPLIALTRTDKNGTRPVRLEAGTLPFTGTKTVRDYEPAISGPVRYRASTDYGTAETSTTLAGQGPRFTVPATPLLSVGVDTVYDYAANRKTRSTVHEVIGRSDPIIVRARMGTRTGTLSILCNDHADLMDLESVCAQGATILYRQAENAGQDMYFHATESASVPNSGAWELTVSYVELAYPAGPVIGPWTFADLAATGDTFAEAAAAYPSFTALLLNTPGPL
jgi:hypothetical protein